MILFTSLFYTIGGPYFWLLVFGQSEECFDGKLTDTAAVRGGSGEFLNHDGVSLSDPISYGPVRNDVRHYGIHDGACVVARNTDKIPHARHGRTLRLLFMVFSLTA